jgi:hypothetical protein
MPNHDKDAFSPDLGLQKESFHFHGHLGRAIGGAFPGLRELKKVGLLPDFLRMDMDYESGVGVKVIDCGVGKGL